MMENNATNVLKPTESDLNKFFFDSRLENLARQLRNTAEFNLFDVLQYSDYEIRHSNVLAWLMNPRQSHGLGPLFLSEILKATSLDKLSLQRLAASSDITVEREKNNFDILVTSAQAKTLVLIENKFWAPIDPEQLKLYRDLVEKDYSRYEIRMCVLLSTSKTKPKEPNWIGVSYRDVYEILERLINENHIKNARAQEFVRQYLELLAETFIKDKKIHNIAEQLVEDHRTVVEFMGAEYEKDSGFMRGYRNYPKDLNEAVKHLFQLKGKYGEIIDSYFWDELLDDLGLVKVGKKDSGYFMTQNLHDLFKNVYRSYNSMNKGLHDSLLLFWYDTWHGFFGIYLYLYPGKKEPVRDKLVKLIKENRQVFNIYQREHGYYRIYEYLILDKSDFSNLNIAGLKKKLKDGFVRFLNTEAPRIERFLGERLVNK